MSDKVVELRKTQEEIHDDVTAPLALLHPWASYSAKAEYPVRRSFTIITIALECWFTRRSLSSGGARRRPGGG